MPTKCSRRAATVAREEVVEVGVVTSEDVPSPTPKLRLDFHFVYALNHTAQVMTEHFAQSFADLRGSSLTAKRITNL
jgi:hypothetical protein